MRAKATNNPAAFTEQKRRKKILAPFLYFALIPPAGIYLSMPAVDGMATRFCPRRAVLRGEGWRTRQAET